MKLSEELRNLLLASEATTGEYFRQAHELARRASELEARLEAAEATIAQRDKEYDELLSASRALEESLHRRALDAERKLAEINRQAVELPEWLSKGPPHHSAVSAAWEAGFKDAMGRVRNIIDGEGEAK